MYFTYQVCHDFLVYELRLCICFFFFSSDFVAVDVSHSIFVPDDT